MKKTITVDGIEYTRATGDGEAMRIVICDNRGLTFVGRCVHPSSVPAGEWLTIHDARCIIVWGTTGHLAELCDGPTSSTKLGTAKTATVNPSMCVAAYEAAGWSK